MNARCLVMAFCVALAIASPWLGVPGWSVSVATVAAFTALGLIGLNLVFGVLGMLAFGQAAFIAIPGYVAGMAEHAGLDTLWAIALGIALTGMIAYVVARIFVHLPGTYFAVGTLGFAFVTEGLARAFPEWTGGASGLVFDSGRSLGPRTWYWLALLALGAGLLGWRWIMRPRNARRLYTVRHDELAAAVIGIDVARVKVALFSVAGLFCAVAGIGLAYYVGVLVPEGAGVNRSLEYVGTLLLGGAGSLLGPLVGAALVQWLFVVSGYGKDYELLIYGAAFLGAVLYARHGIVGLVRPWLGKRAPAAAAHSVRAPTASVDEPRAPVTVAGAELIPVVARAVGTTSPTDGSDSIRPSRAPISALDSATREPTLRIERIAKNFGGVQALRDVSFAVSAGEIFALVGPNGAGKSTLFNIISGVERPSAGQVLLDANDLADVPIHRRAPRIGRAFQVARLVPELSVLENLQCRLDQIEPAASEGVNRAAALAQLHAFELDALADRSVGSLAAGQHKLIDLARAALGSPRAVLLDEPAVGLTPVELDHLRDLLLRLRDQGCAVVVVEHNIDFVASVADRGVVLDGGVVIAAGEFATIIREPAVQEAYFGVLQ